MSRQVFLMLVGLSLGVVASLATLSAYPVWLPPRTMWGWAVTVEGFLFAQVVILAVILRSWSVRLSPLWWAPAAAAISYLLVVENHAPWLHGIPAWQIVAAIWVAIITLLTALPTSSGGSDIEFPSGKAVVL